MEASVGNPCRMVDNGGTMWLFNFHILVGDMVNSEEVAALAIRVQMSGGTYITPHKHPESWAGLGGGLAQWRGRYGPNVMWQINEFGRRTAQPRFRILMGGIIRHPRRTATNTARAAVK